MSEDRPPEGSDGMAAWLAKRLLAAGENDMQEVRQRVTNIETALQTQAAERSEALSDRKEWQKGIERKVSDMDDKHSKKLDSLQSDVQSVKDALLTRGIVTDKEKTGQAVKAGGVGAVAAGVIYAIIELIGKMQ